MIKQGREPRGIFGSGWAISEAFPDENWNDDSAHTTCMYVKYKWDFLVDPVKEPLLPRAVLDDGVLGKAHWNTQMSGIRIPDDAAAELERVWRRFVQSRAAQAPHRSLEASTEEGQPSSNGAGFGEPERNAKVEAAAVKRVMRDYRGRGWKVRSVERLRCGFDLRCSKGNEVEEVEVKGASGMSTEFIITAGELNQAKSNPHFVLYVVTEALARRPHLHRFAGKEFLARFRLTPIQFRANPTPSYGNAE